MRSAGTPKKQAPSSWSVAVEQHGEHRHPGVDVPVGRRPAVGIPVGPALVRLGVAVQVGLPAGPHHDQHRSGPQPGQPRGFVVGGRRPVGRALLRRGQHQQRDGLGEPGRRRPERGCAHVRRACAAGTGRRGRTPAPCAAGAAPSSAPSRYQRPAERGRRRCRPVPGPTARGRAPRVVGHEPGGVRDQVRGVGPSPERHRGQVGRVCLHQDPVQRCDRERRPKRLVRLEGHGPGEGQVRARGPGTRGRSRRRRRSSASRCRAGGPSRSNTVEDVGVRVAVVHDQGLVVTPWPWRYGRRTPPLLCLARRRRGFGSSPVRSPRPPGPGGARPARSITCERLREVSDRIRAASLGWMATPATTAGQRSAASTAQRDPATSQPIWTIRETPTSAARPARLRVPVRSWRGDVQVAVRVDHGYPQRLGRSGRSTVQAWHVRPRTTVVELVLGQPVSAAATSATAGLQPAALAVSSPRTSATAAGRSARRRGAAPATTSVTSPRSPPAAQATSRTGSSADLLVGLRQLPADRRPALGARTRRPSPPGSRLCGAAPRRTPWSAARRPAPASRRRRSPALRGRKPSKQNRSTGSPDTASAVSTADGPGTAVTAMPCSTAAETSR